MTKRSAIKERRRRAP